MQKFLEKIFKKLVYYVVPLVVIAILLLSYFKKIQWYELQSLFANRWINLLLVVLFMKPLVIIPPKYSKINLFTIRECITYFTIERTKKPILQYLFDWIKNLIFSIAFYLMKFRRELGILVFRCIFLHFSLLEISRFSQWMTFVSTISKPFTIAWLIWLSMLLIWFLTSNAFSVKLLKTKRKLIQKVSYIAFIAAICHLVLLNPWENRTYLIWLIIYLVLKYYEKKPKKVSSNPITPPVHPIPPNPTEKKEPVLLPQISAKILKRDFLNPTVIELVFQINQKLESIPWQWILLNLHDNQWDFTRVYSIAEHEIEDDKSVITLLIKIKDIGRASNFFKNIAIWENIQIKWIYGKFVLQKNDSPKVFIATGTWLSPIYNMLVNDSSPDKLLLFSVSYQKDLFYEDHIKKIKNLTYKYCISRENIDWYEFGRVDLSKFDFKPETEFYICWNPSMVKTQQEFLLAKGFSKIYVEQY